MRLTILNNPNCVPENCHLENMNSELMETLANNPDRMRKDGQKSQSIFGPPIFPLIENYIFKFTVPVSLFTIFLI